MIITIGIAPTCAKAAAVVRFSAGVVVDEAHAGVQLVGGDALAAREIAHQHARAQPELAGVGDGDGMLLIGRLDDGGHRPENLVGCSLDGLTRIAARQLAERTGQQAVMENRAGASGAIALQAVIDLVGGQVPLAILGATPVLPHIQSGKLKAYAATTRYRIDSLPDVPTMQEAGLNGFDAAQWYVVATPRGTPAGVLGKLNAWINETRLPPR